MYILKSTIEVGLCMAYHVSDGVFLYRLEIDHISSNLDLTWRGWRLLFSPSRHNFILPKTPTMKKHIFMLAFIAIASSSYTQTGKTEQADPLSPIQTDHWKPGFIDPPLFDKNSKELFLSQRA